MKNLKRVISFLLIAATVLISSPGFSSTAAAATFGENAVDGGSACVDGRLPLPEKAPKLIYIVEDENGFDYHYEDEYGNIVEPSEYENNSAKGTSLPESYDSRELGIITSVKNQNPYGTCWAFATISCLETYIIKNKLIPESGFSSLDLSENQLAYFKGYSATTNVNDRTYGDGSTATDYQNAVNGGNFYYSVSVLARGTGPVAESVSPYKTQTVSEDIRYSRDYSLGTSYFCPDATPEVVKAWIMEYGAVQGSYYSDEYYYYKGTFYNPGSTGGSTNHAVTIVGWDDNYSKDNFDPENKPDGNGAWLVKNSWGTTSSYLKNGYFWLSYYEKSFAKAAVYTLTEKADNVYQYDATPPATAAGYMNSCKQANVYTADGNEIIKSVGFYFDSLNRTGLSYRVRIYSLANASKEPDDGTLLAETTGTCDYYGFYVAEFDNPVSIKAGQAFAAEVLFEGNGSDTVYFVAEGNEQHCTQNVSYFTYNDGYEWVVCESGYGNLQVKVYTVEDAVGIDSTNFPDAVFRKYVSDEIDGNGNGKLSVAEISDTTEINVAGIEIKSLAGIEFFTALTVLDCSDNLLTELDVSKNISLLELWCDINEITEIDLSENTKLEKIGLSNNCLTALDLSKNTALTELHCQYTQITSLDLTDNTALEKVDCSENLLETLDVSKNTALSDLNCSGNQLTELNLSKNTELIYLYCAGNKLTALDLSKNTKITEISCSENRLTAIDVSNSTALESLWCDNNQLTELDVSKNTALSVFNCSGNRLSELDLSKNKLLTENDMSCYGQRVYLTQSDVKKINDNSYEIVIGGETRTFETVPKSFGYNYSVHVGDSETVIMDVKVYIGNPGDLDGNGKVNGIDVILIQRYIAEWDVVIDETNADVNKDGEVNGIDEILLARYLANWNVVLK